MELEFFCKPGEDLEWFAFWRETCKNWLLSLGMSEESMRLRDHGEEELSHYSNATTDIEFKFHSVGANFGALHLVQTST